MSDDCPNCDAHCDEFTFVSTDDISETHPRPLPLYPEVVATRAAANGRNPDISPWSEPPTTRRTFPYMPFSRPSLPSPPSLRSRQNDTHSVSSGTYVASVSDMSIADSRRTKGSLGFFSDIIMKTRSRAKLASSDSINDSTSSFAPFTSSPSQLSVDTYPSSLHLDFSPDVPPAFSLPPKKDKDRSRKRSRLNKPHPAPSTNEPLLKIDTDFTHMEDIIHINAASESLGSRPSAPSTLDSTNFGPTRFTPASPPTSIFTDPFHPSSVSSKHKQRHDRKVSPKTRTASFDLGVDAEQLTEREWTAPESWAIERDGGDAVADGASSGSEESPVSGSSRALDDSATVTDLASRKRTRRKTHYAHKPLSSSSNKFVLVRIYRANGSYHVAQIPPHATVADLTPSLNAKVLRDNEREIHRLYLKERGRERMLAPTERPAQITRRRLEQAGYDQLDSLDYLAAEDMTFLLKFVYKSQLLGPTVEDLNLDDFEYVDLTGCGLPTIPVIFHKNAESIVFLNLSRNPMLEIPLDFIQSCTTLRELRLSSMAMKKVPQSVRHSASLHRLDLSCNRIVDLDDAGLDRIPELSILKLQNNRMEQLPWYFPRLRMLKTLNISNNKFSRLPSVICEMLALRDLDISFNMITELPEDIGRLIALEQLIFVGNQVSRLPEQCNQLVNLQVLDCRRNSINDLSITRTLPRLEKLLADHNVIHALDLSHGPHSTAILDVSFNDITLLKLVPSAQTPFMLTSLEVSNTKLSSLDDFALSHLSALQHLKLDHNLFRTLPDCLGELSHLLTLSCSDNHLDALPETIGSLRRLETLDAHNNSLRKLPISLWECSSLTLINLTSNLIDTWHDPPDSSLVTPPATGITLELPPTPPGPRSRLQLSRKASSATVHTPSSNRPAPPLAYSLEKLYVGENRLTDDCLPPFMILKELRVLNLSFNEIQELPSSFLRNLTRLEELYLSGNQLTSIPTEDLPRLTRLSVLFLNGNKLQTLPQELGKVQSLTVIDAGSNVLRYNINNWEFDWNWNFNPNLKYLNLSGNKRLEIKSDDRGTRRHSGQGDKGRIVLADFSELTSLRVLGLMDVTTTFLPNIPEESEDRRVRTSLSEVNKMSYGIADNLGITGYLTMFDLVQPEFRGHKDEAVFAMFGRSDALPNNNHLSKYLHDNFISQFIGHLNVIDPSKSETVLDALRRTFLRLNKSLHDSLYANPSNRKMSQVSASTAGTASAESSYRAGASGIVLYFAGKTMYMANAGDALAVVSMQGSAELFSRKHDPFDRRETERIRTAEGWISPKGLIHEEIDTSRSFGYFYHFPVVNARPDVAKRQLTEQDEFVIIGNRGLWDYISYQTAVDIARSEISDPMIAAQKLRDFAISYGSDGSTMIMVICIADLFRPKKQPATDLSIDGEPYSALKRRGGKKTDIQDRTIARLDYEVSPPIGHLCLVFTDIRNSTQLWEANAGMPTAMKVHNNLLRRQLRICGGYVVKTEGDAFMCSFPTTLAALWWALTVQVQLMHEPWPHEILACEEGKEVWDSQGNLIARGLSVRMGMHCGTPVCEPDPITNRMDYFGPMVIRAARICGNTAGGQIVCSADVVREINARVTETGPDTEYSEFQPPQAIEAVRRMNIKVIPVGEIKLKGLEIPEMVSLIYPGSVAGRQDMDLTGGSASASVVSSPPEVQWSIDQVRELAVLCLRFEALASGRVFRPFPKRKESVPSELSEDEVFEPLYMYGDPDQLLPPMHDKMGELEIMMVMDSLLTRLDNAASAMTMTVMVERIEAMQTRGELDEWTLNLMSSLALR
ncbi:hypothetical protein JVU11DRAFT_2939 [Chiua virens]|nr:hypothetical protein JVU11DRAFT_2939 [Chiua virens]